MKTSFILHIDSLKILDEMTDEQRGKLFHAIYRHQLGEKIECDFWLKMAITPFINQFKRDDEKWQSTKQQRVIAGAKGGKQKVANATKSKQKTPVSVNVNVNDSVNVSVSASNNDNISFDEFWNLYDKKVGNKTNCEKKWKALANEIQEKIIATLPTFKKSVNDIQFLPYPETYLNQARWNDEPIKPIVVEPKEDITAVPNPLQYFKEQDMAELKRKHDEKFGL